VSPVDSRVAMVLALGAFVQPEAVARSDLTPSGHPPYQQHTATRRPPSPGKRHLLLLCLRPEAGAP
jgi:hypothetical protein